MLTHNVEKSVPCSRNFVLVNSPWHRDKRENGKKTCCHCQDWRKGEFGNVAKHREICQKNVSFMCLNPLVGGRESMICNDIIKNVRRAKFTSISEYMPFTLATFLIS